MTLLSPAIHRTTTTAAAALAATNYAANTAALFQTQPQLQNQLTDLPADMTWTFGRDGSLTAMDTNDKWWANCSLPLLASRAMLKSLDTNNQVSCFLAPVHAGQLIAARERMGNDPALIVVIPDPTVLRVILACHDFSTEIGTHHLWFVTGDDGATELKELFNANPGLPTPGRFIKTKLTPDEMIEPMIAEAQKVFGDVLNDRAASLESIRSTWNRASTNQDILLIAGSRFRLWEDASATLRSAVDQTSGVRIFDCDDPASAAPIALAQAVQNSRVILSANISRGDAVNLIPPTTRWITWLTRPQVPSFELAAAEDVLIVADPTWKSPALAAGWPAKRVLIAGWPAQSIDGAKQNKPELAIIADTCPIEIPPSVEDLSSHRVLWEFIQDELHHSPLVIGKIETYLDDRCRRYAIQPEAIDRRAFFESLIVPAYQQGLARLIQSAGLPLKLHGTGWDELDEFRSRSAGPITTREALHRAVQCATALVYPWPVRFAHSMDSLGKPIVTASGHRPEAFLREVRTAISGTQPAYTPPGKSLANILKSLLQEHHGSTS